MARQNQRQKASDLFRESTPMFGTKGTLAEVYPQIKDIIVEVQESGYGVDSWNSNRTYTKDFFPGEFIDCSNPSCFGGGFQLGSYLRRMVTEGNTELEDSKSCRGNEGSPKGRRIYRSCINTFEFKIKIQYETQPKQSVANAPKVT
jgi:hypothetical protein